MGSSSRPTTQTSQVRQEYPEFFKPHLERVLQGAQTEFGRDYTPFPDPRLVDTPAARTEALTALQAPELTQFSQPMFETALAGTAEAAKTFPETDLESYMNPYQQLVTDQLLRKAGERRGIARKGISDAAAKAGAFGGGRHGVTEGLFDEATQEQLQDIQDRSDMANFQNALAASQTDKTRGLQAALQTSQLGEGQRKSLIEGQIGREKAATAEQALGQQKRDVGYQEFQEQLGFPQQKLAEYSSIIRGHTPPPNQWQTGTMQTPVSGFQQAAGLGTLLAGASGFMPSKEGGVIKRVSGGEIDDEGNVIAGGYGDFEAGVIDAVSDSPTARLSNQEVVYGDSGLSTIPVSRADTMDRHDFQSLADIENEKSIRDALQADSAMLGKGWSEALRDYLKGQVGEDSPERHYDMSHTRRDEPITIGPYPTGNEFIHGPDDKNPGAAQADPAAYPYPPSTPLVSGVLPPSQRVDPTPPVSGLLPPSQREVLDRDQRWKDKFLNVKKGGPIKFGHGGHEGSAGVQVYIDKLSDMADQLALSLKSNMGELPPSHYQHEENKMPKEWEPSPDVPDYYGDVFGESTPDSEDVRGLPTFDEAFPPVSSQRIVTKEGGPISDQNLSTYMREGSRSIPREDRTQIKEMYESGLQSLAYGGVPGQAYTEDIGMMGGLGAVAGPQLRFAYGGVPGQAYTEDIGMMGGLGAVAGPQLRFQKAGEIEEVEEVEEESVFKPGVSPYGSLSMPQKGLSSVPVTDENGESSAFVQDIKDYFGIEDQLKEFEERRRLQYEKAPHTRKSIWDYYTEPRSDPSAIATKEKLSEATQALEKHEEDSDQSKPEEKVEEDVWGSMSQEEIGAEFDLQDREHGETGRDLLGSGDETITQDDAPEVVKKKEAVQKEKWGPNWRLMGIGMNLMRGTEAGMKDASALIAKMPTPQDKILAKLKLDYMKMRTEKGRAETSGKFMERVFDMQYKTEEQRRKARDQLHKLAETDGKEGAAIFKEMDTLTKSSLMELNEQEQQMVDKNPNMLGHLLVRKAKNLARSLRPSSEMGAPPAQPEEETTLMQSILGDYHPENLFKAGGGDIPEPLRQLGVSSIRKI